MPIYGSGRILRHAKPDFRSSRLDGHYGSLPNLRQPQTLTSNEAISEGGGSSIVRRPSLPFKKIIVVRRPSFPRLDEEVSLEEKPSTSSSAVSESIMSEDTMEDLEEEEEEEEIELPSPAQTTFSQTSSTGEPPWNTQLVIESLDASVSDLKQELLDLQSSVKYYRTRLDNHNEKTEKAWSLIERFRQGKRIAPDPPRPPPVRVFKSSLNRGSSVSCQDLSCTGAGVDRRWSISSSRLSLVEGDKSRRTSVVSNR